MKRNKATIITMLLCALCIAGAASTGLCEEEWQEYRSHHFIIYYRDAPIDFVESVEEMAEHYYKEIAANLGFTRYQSWSWEDRGKIYIYRDRDDYITAAKQASWSHGVASLRKKTIRTFPTAHGFFDSTLPHELGHLIFREFIGFRARIPLWFEEGIAMYQEKARRWGSHGLVLKAMKDGTFIPLGTLTTTRLYRDTPRETIDLFYTESASVVYYLISEFGRYKFVSFCRKLKEGKKFTSALKEVYIRFKDIDDLNDAWVSYLKRTEK